MLIVARVVQGLGAGMMMPQTMSIITRIFPPRQRATAMALWGSAAGVATLVGPIAGGLLVDSVGWEWIFFVNVPIGVIGLIVAWLLVPHLPTRAHSFDWVGVVLSAIGLFMLVFGIQEGSAYDWGHITSSLDILGWHSGIPVSVPFLIIAGAVMMVLFVLWQAVTRREPLVPLSLFTDRNFAAASVGIAAMGATVIALSYPITIYFQSVHGMTPTEAALMTTPMAVLSGVLAPVVGGLITRMDPKWLAAAGFLSMAAGLLWLRHLMTPDASIVLLLLPFALLGLGNALIWGPLSITATRNLPPRMAGAGSGVYNELRQIGSVLGSAAVATIMSSQITSRIADAMADRPVPSGQTHQVPTGDAAAMPTSDLPPFLHDAFSRAMGDTLWLPILLSALGLLAALCFAPPVDEGRWDEG